MKHRLGRAWEPVGSHGINYRRKCDLCGQVFVVNSPTENVDEDCDLTEVRKKQFFGHPDMEGTCQ